MITAIDDAYQTMLEELEETTIQDVAASFAN
jgi:hypothetical protein